MNIYTLIACCFFYANGLSQSQVSVINNSKESSFINEKTYYFKEDGHDLNIQEVLSSSIDDTFKPLNGKMHFGFSPNAHWFKFSIKHTSSQPSNYFLEIGYADLDELSFYEVKNNSLVNEQKLGDKLPFITRKEQFRHHLVVLYLSDTLIHTYYLRVASTNHLIVPLNLYTPREYVSKDNMSTLELGVAIGLLLLAACYTLGLFISTREKKYLYYCLFILSSMAFIVLRTGIGAMYIWPSVSIWESRPTGVFLYLILSFSTLFANSFLELNRHAPRWSYVLKIEVAIYVCILLVLAYDSEKLFLVLPSIMAFFHNILMVITGVIVWKKGYQSARLYTIGMFLFAATSILHILGFLTLLPVFFMSLQFMRCGLYLEVLFLTIAVSKNYQEMMRALIVAKIDEENKKKETNQLLSTIDQKQKELATLSMKIQSKNNTLEDLKTRFEKTESIDTKKELSKFKNLINDNLRLDEDWETFKIHFESVHDHFFEQLQSHTLSVNELKLCAYIRINLSTKEIARMLLVKPTSVQVARHRLKKKLNLTEQDDLIDFIRKL